MVEYYLVLPEPVPKIECDYKTKIYGIKQVVSFKDLYFINLIKTQCDVAVCLNKALVLLKATENSYFWIQPLYNIVYTFPVYIEEPDITVHFMTRPAIDGSTEELMLIAIIIPGRSFERLGSTESTSNLQIRPIEVQPIVAVPIEENQIVTLSVETSTEPIVIPIVSKRKTSFFKRFFSCKKTNN